MSPSTQTVHEARIVRAKAPRCYRLSALRRWRWQVTAYFTTEGEHPGVFDRRVHLGDEVGHTFTVLGAYIAMGRVVRQARYVAPGGLCAPVAPRYAVKSLGRPPLVPTAPRGVPPYTASDAWQGQP